MDPLPQTAARAAQDRVESHFPKEQADSCKK